MPSQRAAALDHGDHPEGADRGEAVGDGVVEERAPGPERPAAITPSSRAPAWAMAE